MNEANEHYQSQGIPGDSADTIGETPDRPREVGLDDDATQNDQSNPQHFHNTDELIAVVSRRQIVDMNDEMMDPLEWLVRQVIAIPAHYYWDVVAAAQWPQVPWRTRAWHHALHRLLVAGDGVQRYVAQPVAHAFGLHEQRFGYVTNTMTTTDWHEARRLQQDRQQSVSPLHRN